LIAKVSPLNIVRQINGAAKLFFGKLDVCSRQQHASNGGFEGIADDRRPNSLRFKWPVHDELRPVVALQSIFGWQDWDANQRQV
jgi:hypothetical protein